MSDSKFELQVIKRLEDIGRARERIKLLLDLDIFDDLSKHNPYWDSENEEVAEKLYKIRCGLTGLLDGLGELDYGLMPEDER